MSKETKDLNVLQRIAEFQQDEVYIHKSKQAFGYKYAPLEIILPLIKPFLEKHRLGITHVIKTKQYLKNGVHETGQFLITYIYNVDDVKDKIKCETLIDENVVLAKQNKFMVLGSAITYFRRYHIVTMLGLTTDEDSDAGGYKPENTSQKPTSKSENKKTGRSVESSESQDGVDYIAIFQNIVKNKDEKQSRKMLSTYAKNMNKELIEKITLIIDKAFEVK